MTFARHYLHMKWICGSEMRLNQRIYSISAKTHGEFCIFPSYGKWRKSVWRYFSSGNIAFTVQIGMICPEGAIDNGDHVVVPKGVTCQLGCVADNGEKSRFRIDSTQLKRHGTVTCSRPIPKENLALYGCSNGECDTDLINNGPNKANWPNKRITDALRQHKWIFRHYYQYISFSEMFDNRYLMKCYPVLDDGCNPADLHPKKEDETDVSWHCPNGHGSGAVCTKTCNNGTLTGRIAPCKSPPFRLCSFRGKSEKTCECKSRCEWKGGVATCKRSDYWQKIPKSYRWTSTLIYSRGFTAYFANVFLANKNSGTFLSRRIVLWK